MIKIEINDMNGKIEVNYETENSDLYEHMVVLHCVINQIKSNTEMKSTRKIMKRYKKITKNISSEERNNKNEQ